MLVHLNIGSNQGNRHGNIDRAVALIDYNVGRVVAQSRDVESEPWGYDSAAKFINRGVNIETGMSPMELLDSLQAIEKTLSAEPHRNADGSYRDRVIDIDIIDIAGGVKINEPRLTVPHKHMHDRDFVMVPYNEIFASLAVGSDKQ